MRPVTGLFAAAAIFVSGSIALAPANGEPRHGLSMYGELKYPANFTHFDYVNPNAPKGGSVKLHSTGTFDSLNSFIIKGSAAAGIGLIYNTLLSHSMDEPFALYGELAKTSEIPKDRSWVKFKLWNQARWHDGQEITADDVIFTFNILRTKGQPLYRHYYANIAKVEKIGPKTVKFHFSGPKNQELPLIIGELTVLPKHYWEKREFSATTLEPPLGSGAYRIDKVEPGRRISFQRVKNYWAKDIPSQKGMYNFDRIQFDYYRDRSVAFEAFKSGQYDYRSEHTSKTWATGYNFPAMKSGLAKRESLPTASTRGAQGFIFNIRREIFKDRRVRAALAYAYDFEWTNKNLFFGLYRRNRSYFDNGELAATGLPSADELKLLRPLKENLPSEVFTMAYEPPNTKGKGGVRRNLRTAKKLLQAAGWKISHGFLKNSKTGKPFNFEVLIRQPSAERIVAPLVANLKRLGIVAKITMVDSSQYVARVLRERNFDMATLPLGQSDSPGNEQRLYWHSSSASQPGSRNFAGISNPAIDKLIDHVIFADSRKGLITATKALDRALQWGHYMIPTMTHNKDWIAYWDRFARPKNKPKFGVGFTQTWWVDPAKDAALKAKRTRK